MANTPQARKRVRQNDKRRSLRASQRAMVRTYVKRVYNAVNAKDTESAKTALQEAVPIIDRMADKGVIHPNKAARHKSRMNAQVKSLSA